MAITPTTLLATSGLISGGGFTINPTMVSSQAIITANPLVTNSVSLAAYAISLPLAGITTALSSLPICITQTASTSTSVTTQAQAILPGAGTAMGNRNFLQAFGGAASFGSGAAEYAAALAQFSSKSFSDLGVGVTNFIGVVTNGVSAMVPAAANGLTALAAQAKSSSALSSLTSVLPANTTVAGSTILTNGVSSLGLSLKNFGGAFDLTNPSSLGDPVAFVKTLQNQNLAGKFGINDAIATAGFDPTKLETVPTGVLTSALTSVQGNDLNAVINTLGMKPINDLTSLNDVLSAENFIPIGAMAVAGIPAGPSGLTSLGNKLTNLGVQVDASKLSGLFNNIEVPSLPNLSAVTSVVPASVTAAIGPNLGNGSGAFGNPTMSDMIGTLAGEVHVDSFIAVKNALNSLMSSSVGQTLNTAMATMVTACAVNVSIASAALPAFSTAVSTFNTQLVAATDLTAAVNAANAGITASLAQISKENTNLGLAGVTLPSGNTPTNLGTSITPFLSFGSKLHDFGVDVNNIGTSKLLASITTSDLTGEAIQAALAEGRNLARTALLGKTTPTIADQAKTTAAALQANLSTYTTGLTVANEKFAAANAAYLANPTSDAQLNLTYATSLVGKAQASVDAVTYTLTSSDIQSVASITDDHLYYSGDIASAWDLTNAERIRRGLTPLDTTRPS